MAPRGAKDEKHIIRLLQQMPKMEDSQNKQKLYHQSAVSNMDKRMPKGKRQKYKIMVPALASIVTVIFIVLIPFIYNSSFNTTSEELTGQNEATEESLTLELEQGNIIEEENYDSLFTAEDRDNRFVIHNTDDKIHMVFGAIPDEQEQYIIPITFIVSSSGNLEEHYNNLDEYIEEHGLTNKDYLLKDVSFSIEDKEHVVKIELPEDFSLGTGSAQAYQFEKMLSTMFSPYGIKKAVFETTSESGADLGPIGSVDEMPLSLEQKASYKLYKERYLIPIPQNSNNSIHEAIHDMKQPIENFQIANTIPEEIDFQVIPSENELILQYTGEEVVENNLQNEIMIDAILMTAKSYGYEFVRFRNFNNKRIGNYLVEEPIKVPDGVNPINIEN